MSGGPSEPHTKTVSLIERLRNDATGFQMCGGGLDDPHAMVDIACGSLLHAARTFSEAADELERLTAYIKQWAEDDAERDAQFQELERVLESLQNKWASRPIDHPNGEALARENERLRAALERIASAGEIHDPHWAGKVAREALAPESEVP